MRLFKLLPEKIALQCHLHISRQFLEYIMVQLIRKFLGSSVTMTGERIYQGNGFWTGDVSFTGKRQRRAGRSSEEGHPMLFPLIYLRSFNGTQQNEVKVYIYHSTAGGED